MSYKDDVINRIIDIEGGYVNDKSDSGGETKYGITKAVARAHGYKLPIRLLPRKTAFEIYEQEYWHSIYADTISKVSKPLAYKLFDVSVNMGSYRAVKYLQRALNVLNNGGKYYKDIPVDGAMGPYTALTLSAYLQKRSGGKGEQVLIEMLTCLQGAFYVELAERREKDEKYIYGWFVNRVIGDDNES